MEAELRLLVTNAVESEISPSIWQAAGFSEVYEMTPGLAYEVWGASTCYRITVMRQVVPSSASWNSRIDQLYVRNRFGNADESLQIWTRATDVPDRYRTDSADQALRDAIRWLGEHVSRLTIRQADAETEPADEK